MRPQENGIIRPYSATLIELNPLIDGALIGLDLLIISQVEGWSWDLPDYLLVLGAVVGYGLLGQGSQLFRSWRTERIGAELVILWRCWILTSLIIVAVAYFAAATTTMLPKEVLTQWLVSVPVLLSVFRITVRSFLRLLRKHGRNFRTGAIVGTNELAQRIADFLIQDRWMGIRWIGYFDDYLNDEQQRPWSPPVPVVGTLAELVEKAKLGEIDIVYIALPLKDEARIKDLMASLADSTATIYYLPDLSSFPLINSRFESFGEFTAITLVDTPFRGGNAFLKRSFDILFACFALLVITLPMAVIAVLIKATSAGPVIFRQKRYGLGGQEFEIWKFRTMSVCEEGHAAVQAKRNDPRVTPLGSFLRRTSLDELPQFINVLQGRMSIVGPRPHPVALNLEHRPLIYNYMQRHIVKPGITGWAQVHGYRGETDTLEKMKKRLDFDLEYICNWSIWLDMEIVLRTIWQGLYHPNAY